MSRSFDPGRRAILRWLCGTPVLTAAGCSGPRPANVSGSVSAAGGPVAGIQVVFVPDGRDGPAAGTHTLPDGKFTVQVLPGRYRVTLFRPAVSGPEPSRSPLPARYGQPSTTPLVVDVPAQGPLDIVVEQDAPAAHP